MTSIEIAAPPDRVFDVLADARRYADWVVGTKAVRRADPDFPAVGESFYPRVGLGPAAVDGKTTVVESARPRLLVLRATAYPIADAVVTLELEESGAGTRVTMREEPTGPAPLRLAQRLGEPLLHRRNVESVRRLKALAERDG